MDIERIDFWNKEKPKSESIILESEKIIMIQSPEMISPEVKYLIRFNQ